MGRSKAQQKWMECLESLMFWLGMQDSGLPTRHRQPGGRMLGSMNGRTLPIG